MRIGAFEVKEPIPELNTPYLFAILRPWIDVNNVGSLVLNELETQYGQRNWPGWLNLVIFSISLAIAQLFAMKRVFAEYPFLI